MLLQACIPLALLTLSALALSSFFRSRFSNTLPVVLFFTIILLYFFYIFNVLHIGRVVVISIYTLMCVYFCIKLFTDRERLMVFRKDLFSRAFVLYIALIALFFVLSSNKFVYLWDCLRLWGAYPKALWSYETLQLGENAMIYPIMQSYPPGMPLLCYFMSSFSKSFDERTLFITYDMFALALSMPIIDGVISVKTGKSRKIVSMCSVLAVSAVLLMPWIICRNDPDGSALYVSLFIDSILGIFCGYHLSLCLNKFALDKFSSICIAFSGSCLVLFKDSGILFALGGMIGGVICSMYKNKTLKLRKDIALCAVASFAAIMAMWGSWRFLLNKYSVTNHLATEVILPSKAQLLQFIISIVKIPATNINFLFIVIQISLPAAIFLILFVKIFLGIINKETDPKAEVIDAVIQIVCYIIFVIGYYFIFRDSIKNGSYPSYTRYVCTLILCSMYILGYDISEKHHDLFCALGKEFKRLLQSRDMGQIFTNVLVSGFCVIFAYMCIEYVKDIYHGNATRTGTEYIHADELADSIIESVPQVDYTIDVYLCIPGDMRVNSRLHHRTYFELIDEHIRIKNFYTQTDISSHGLGYSSDRFIEELVKEHYSYVMFTEIDDIFYDEYNDILGDVSVGDRNIVYFVDAINNNLIRI